MMKKYRKKPEVLEAVRWYPSLDLQDVPMTPYSGDNVGSTCVECLSAMSAHVVLETEPGGISRLVCPGDWIVKDSLGRFSPMDPDVFAAYYAEVDDDG